MSEFSFFRFGSCGVLTDDELEHKDEIVQLTEEVLHARGQECLNIEKMRPKDWLIY
jgi:hypothetical protein